MNLNSFKIYLILNFFVVCVVFGEATLPEKKVLTNDSGLHNKNILRDFSESSHLIINDSNYNAGSENVEKSSWFLNVPLLPVIVATSNSIPEGSCKRQLQLYINHLKNGTLWATEMFDSSAKYPYGLFDGFTRHLGSFDQCKRIQTKIVNNKSGKIDKIRSRYCLVDVKFKEKNEPTVFTGKYEILFDPQVSAWEAVREKGDFRRYPRYLLQMALCFPSDCQTEEILAALKQPLEKFGTEYNLQVEASISSMYCTKESPKFSNYDKVFCFTFLSIFTIVIISTIITKHSDVNKELSSSKELLSCFSAHRSFNEIFRVNYGHCGFDSIHFFRVLLMALTIFGHRQSQYMYVGTIRGNYLEWVFSNPSFGLFQNGALIIDGFFGLGGLVLSFFTLKMMNETKKMNFFHLIIKRLVRLWPLFMFITFGYATIFYRLGSGPFWESIMGFYRDSCRSYWWANFLFVNNYFGGNNKCILQSWYLAVDFQSYVIGLLLISAFYKVPRKICYIFLVCTLILSAAIPFYFTYKHDLDPVFKSVTSPRRIEDSEHFLNIHIKTHFRLAPYIVGLIVGILIYDYENSNWRLSKAWSQILFTVAIFVCLTVQWIGTFFMNPNLETTAFMKALYSSLQKPIFAFCICSFPLLFTIGDGLDFYRNILTARWLQPISRISFSIFLTHLLVIQYEMATTRTTFTLSIYNSVKYFTGDLIYSLCLGLLFAVVIELPSKNFINVLLKRKTRLMIFTP